MLHKEFWGLLFLLFVGWIFIASNAEERIEKACRPVGWTGNVVVSVVALTVPSQQVSVQGWFNKFEYGCQYLTWRVFYQNDYNEYLDRVNKTQSFSGAPGTPPDSGPLVGSVENQP